MTALLRSFASLALVSGVIMSLLPEGSIKRTAAMTVGLLMLLCWLEGLQGLLPLPEGTLPPYSPLSGTGMTLASASAAARESMQALWEATP